MSPKLHHTLKNLFRIFLILFGNALYSLAVVAFILPSGIITGGTTGLALASAHWFHTPITAFVLCFNVLTFLLGLFVLGWKFAATTLLSTFLYPILLAFWQQFPALSSLTDDAMLCTILGGMMIGAGIGIVIRAGASTGGMDIPPLILKKLFHLPVSATLYVFDFSILILQMFFSDIEESLYGILLVMIYTFVLDKVLVIGTHQARADIVSSHYEEIRQAIFTRLDRGCTLLNATTGYLQTDQPVLMTVVSRREMASLNQIVSQKCLMNGVQYPLFISAPQGSQQVTLRAVPGEAVDDCFRWKIPQTQLQNGNIFLQFQRLYPACLPLRRQIRVPEDVEQMEFHALRPTLTDIAGGLRHHFRCFAGKPQDLMDNDRHADGFQILHRPVEYRQVIAPAEIPGAFRVDRLQAQLHPHRLDAIQLLQ